VWRAKQDRWIPKRWTTRTVANTDTPFCVGQRVKFAEGSGVFTGVIAEVHGGSAPESKAMPKYVVQCDDGDEATKVHRSIIPFTLSQATTTVNKAKTTGATKLSLKKTETTSTPVHGNGATATASEDSNVNPKGVDKKAPNKKKGNAKTTKKGTKRRYRKKAKATTEPQLPPQLLNLTTRFVLTRDSVILPAEQLFCVCRVPEDGAQAVECVLCKEWFHTRCM